ncbi:MAG: ABC transporter substrate-binding protein [Candidatus Rokubacteria bacterium]|nr:ABC transporter substrate-binding protein [Candidatus Rokubacteria bacterium]
MTRHGAFALALLLLPALVTAAHAAPSRIGILLPGQEWMSAVDGLKDGLKDLGYVEGRDILYTMDNANRDQARVAEITRRFMAERVDVLFTITNTALKTVIAVTKAGAPPRVPVVFGSASGPVESGIVPAYATPDTHVTGVTSGSIELVGKRLEILKEVLPDVRRVALIGEREADSSLKAFALAAELAPKLGLSVIELRVAPTEDTMEVARRVTRKEADALFLVPSLKTVGATTQLAAYARSVRLPFIVYQVEHIRKSGALVAYGSSYYLQSRQAAVLVSKILKGASPAQLPIERPRLHHLILNLDTAAEIGVRFSPEILNRADELIGGRRAR